MLHSEQGWQYRLKEVQRMFPDVSMSRKGNCLDNGVMENFFGKLKVKMFQNTVSSSVFRKNTFDITMTKEFSQTKRNELCTIQKSLPTLILIFIQSLYRAASGNGRLKKSFKRMIADTAAEFCTALTPENREKYEIYGKK